MEPAMLSKGCRCDPDHIRDVVGKFNAAERTEMADEEGVIRVECEFCAKNFPLELTDF
jgi:molecular chaperone Hsp33